MLMSDSSGGHQKAPKAFHRPRGPLSFWNFWDDIPQILDVEHVLYFNRLKLDT